MKLFPDEMIAYLFIGLTSSTRVSKACRKGVVVDAVEEVYNVVNIPSGDSIEVS